MEFGIGGRYRVSEPMGSLFEENDFGVEGVSHKLALIRMIFCLDNVTEFCLGYNRLQTMKFVVVLLKIDSFSYSFFSCTLALNRHLPLPINSLTHPQVKKVFLFDMFLEQGYFCTSLSVLAPTWISFQIPTIFSVAKSPGLPSFFSEKPGGESFRIITIHSELLHPLSFPWKRVLGWREEED
ncbi:hypothetical protein CDAR_189981 [Caerostris darwini]|uniref:Uncharacterized protein n=1 Tax=Caerostris darwini TaxID=1538125 RepID=A0AAV4QRZ1_9ARAC|nr:hypothetical protein CDAR_189981 [Caerostris darwini]